MDGAASEFGLAAAGVFSSVRSATHSTVQFARPQSQWHSHRRHCHVCATATAGSDMIITSPELSRYKGRG